MKLIHRLEGRLRTVTRFAGLNLCWLLGTALGLGLLGFFPATVALFQVTRQWVLEDAEEISLRLFFSHYRACFVRANLGGWLFAVIGLVLYLNHQLIVAADGAVPLPLVLCFLLTVGLYLMLAAVAVPAALHFNGGTLNALLKTLYFVLGRLPMAFVMLCTVWAVGWLSLAFPALLLFFSGSVTAYALTSLFHQTLGRLLPADRLT